MSDGYFDKFKNISLSTLDAVCSERYLFRLVLKLRAILSKVDHKFESPGRVVFSTASRHSLVADNYKQRQIEFYDSHSAPFLDHYRQELPVFLGKHSLRMYICLGCAYQNTRQSWR
jgi:hypothetical protein